MFSVLPCLDSDARAQELEQRLILPRERAQRLGREAVSLSEAGEYGAPSGRTVDLRAAISESVSTTVSIPPHQTLPPPPSPRRRHKTTTLQVIQASSQDAAQALSAARHQTLILNFANGTIPGGGFLTGSRAQEECLARSSALYLTLRDDPMYAAHRQRPRPDATDWAILSPEVPFFRSEDGTPLETPWSASVLTCAAPVARRIGIADATALMAARIPRVLDIAEAYGFDGLVLGAWGCGAFGNDPTAIAALFRDALQQRPGAFATVVFAISDWSPERRFLAPFRDAFPPTSA